MTLLILVVDDEADVEVLFRQQFRRDFKNGEAMVGMPFVPWAATPARVSVNLASSLASTMNSSSPKNRAPVLHTVQAFPMCIAARRGVRGQDSRWTKTCRPPGGTTDQIRASRQCANRQDPRSRNPIDATHARR